jgi:hypothetical protein
MPLKPLILPSLSDFLQKHASPPLFKRILADSGRFLDRAFRVGQSGRRRLWFVARVLCAGHENRLLGVCATISVDIGAAGRQWRRNLGQEFALVVCWCLRLRVEGRGEHCLFVADLVQWIVQCVVGNVGFRWGMESLMVFLRLSSRREEARSSSWRSGVAWWLGKWHRPYEWTYIYVRTYTCNLLSLHTLHLLHLLLGCTPRFVDTEGRTNYSQSEILTSLAANASL